MLSATPVLAPAHYLVNLPKLILSMVQITYVKLGSWSEYPNNSAKNTETKVPKIQKQIISSKAKNESAEKQKRQEDYSNYLLLYYTKQMILFIIKILKLFYYLNYHRC